MAEMIEVEVVYALPEKQLLLALEVPEGSRVEDVIRLSDIQASFPDMVVDPKRVGIFGRRCTLDEIVQAGDRVEIYRPLIADPKEVRRKRAAASE